MYVYELIERLNVLKALDGINKIGIQNDGNEFEDGYYFSMTVSEMLKAVKAYEGDPDSFLHDEVIDFRPYNNGGLLIDTCSD